MKTQSQLKTKDFHTEHMQYRFAHGQDLPQIITGILFASDLVSFLSLVCL